MRGLLCGTARAKDPYLAFPAGITQVRGNKRLDILAKMNLRNTRRLDPTQIKSVGTATREAVNLMRSPALKSFELDKEDPKTLPGMAILTSAAAHCWPSVGGNRRAFRAGEPGRIRYA